MELGALRVEDLDKIAAGVTPCHYELVVTRRQNFPWHLHCFAERNLRQLIRFVRVSGQFENESKCDDETSDHTNL